MSKAKGPSSKKKAEKQSKELDKILSSYAQENNALKTPGTWLWNAYLPMRKPNSNF